MAQIASEDAAQNDGNRWSSRIIETGEADPTGLIGNPRNWRLHPRHQSDALAAALDEVGWVQPVIVNKTSGHLIDGHLRVALALDRGERQLPVSYVELDEREERLVLATLDPLAALAGSDEGALKSLLSSFEGDLDQTLARMLDDLARVDTTVVKLPTQEEIDQKSEELEHRFDGSRQDLVIVICPDCGHEFAINPGELVYGKSK